MPRLTAPGCLRVCPTSSQLAELRILSAILSLPVLGNVGGIFPLAYVDYSQRSIWKGKSQIRHSHRLSYTNAFDPACRRRTLHTTPCRRAAQSAQQLEVPNITDEAKPDSSESQNLQDTQVKQSASNEAHACALCEAELPSEEALDEHLVTCWPQHQEKYTRKGAEISNEVQDWSLEEEKAKLDQVRRLEDDLRKARHELKLVSQRRQNRYGGNGILDVYHAAKPTPEFPISKQDYLNLVDIYFHASQANTASSPDDSPNPIFLEDQPYEDQAMSTEIEIQQAQPGLSLLAQVDKKLRNDKLRELNLVESFVDLLLDPRSRYDSIFEAYQRFPSPGILHLPAATIRTFLRRMALPPRKTPTYMLRYISIIDEMQAAKMPISRAEWNAAINLAGKSFNTIEEKELERSVIFFKKMEEEAGIRASSATFNILFDIAVKAGQFLFAQGLVDEMTRRGTRLNRIGRVSYIWYCGRMGMADAVRQAYHDFVEAGEVVDTLVLNTVMVAFCNAREIEAAEQIYERMKDVQLRNPAPDDDNEGERDIFTRYPPPGEQSFGPQKASHLLRWILIHAPRLRTLATDSYLAIQAQARAHISPDIFTYRTLIAYHVERTGNLDRITVLLDDMTRVFGLRMSSMIFLLLFKGFAMNGGTRHSKWTTARLNTVWDAFASGMKKQILPRSVIGEPSDRAHLLQSKDTDGKPKQLFSADDFFSSFDNEASAAKRPSTRVKPSLENKHPQALDQTPWGRFLRDFTHQPEEHTETDHDQDPGGADEPEAFPFSNPNDDSRVPSTLSDSEPSDAEDYYKIRPSKWLIIWAVRAFSTCTRDRRRVEEVYFDLMDNWVGPTEIQLETVNEVMASSLNEIDKGIIGKQWWRRQNKQMTYSLHRKE